MALLWLCGVLLLASPCQAQNAEPTSVERIEQMRDRAGRVVDEPVGEEAGASVEDATSGEQADQAPLAPNESLPLGAGEGDLFNGEIDSSDSGSLGDGWLLSTLAALGVVLAIVFGIRWVLRRGGVVSTATPQGGIVEVLSRTTVAPRSHVILMRVGTRILVVSDSSAGMRTLATVQDAEEVAELLGTIDAAKPTSISQNFGSVMKKLSGQWSGEEQSLDQEDLAMTAADESDDRTSGALTSLRGRLAALTDAGGRA